MVCVLIFGTPPHPHPTLNSVEKPSRKGSDPILGKPFVLQKEPIGGEGLIHRTQIPRPSTPVPVGPWPSGTRRQGTTAASSKRPRRARDRWLRWSPGVEETKACLVVLFCWKPKRLLGQWWFLSRSWPMVGTGPRHPHKSLVEWALGESFSPRLGTRSLQITPKDWMPTRTSHPDFQTLRRSGRVPPFSGAPTHEKTQKRHEDAGRESTCGLVDGPPPKQNMLVSHWVTCWARSDGDFRQGWQTNTCLSCAGSMARRFLFGRLRGRTQLRGTLASRASRALAPPPDTSAAARRPPRVTPMARDHIGTFTR